MSDYTPTTEEVRQAVNDRFVQTLGKASFTREQFNRWFAEEKAKAWQEGAIWQRANAVPDDRRMRARFVGELQAVNPYREGTK